MFKVKPGQSRRNITIRAMEWVPKALSELIDIHEARDGIRFTQGQMLEKVILDAFAELDGDNNASSTK